MVSKSGSRFQGYRNFTLTSKDSNFLLMVTKYFDSVQNKIKGILKSKKGMKHKEAESFIDKMFTLDSDRMKQLKGEINDDYSAGLSVEKCAEKVIGKYYGITKMNKFKSSTSQDEVTEVSEKVTSSFYHYKKVSSSLFWNFTNRVNKLGIQFTFDTSYINKLDNSLNYSGYVLYMETPEVDTKDVEYEFMNSELLSNLLKVITSNKYEGEGIKFFIAIDKDRQMRFGYILNDKRYTFGGFGYKSSDIIKLNPCIKVLSGDIDINKLGVKFKSTIQYIWHYMDVLQSYLKNYDNVNTYVSVINNKLSLIVESTGNSDVINSRYIENILQNNIGKRLQNQEFEVKETQYKGKTLYYINLK